MFNLLKRRYRNIEYSDIFQILETGSLDDCHALLAFHTRINYLNAVDSMLLKYRKPDGDVRNLTLHSTQQKGEFELAIINVPWHPGNFSFLPLILQRGSGVIYGIMLPFNELLEVLTPRQQRQIGELGMNWTKFAIERQMGIQLDS